MNSFPSVTFRHRKHGSMLTIVDTPVARARFFQRHGQDDWEEVSAQPSATPQPGQRNTRGPGQRATLSADDQEDKA